VIFITRREGAFPPPRLPARKWCESQPYTQTSSQQGFEVKATPSPMESRKCRNRRYPQKNRNAAIILCNSEQANGSLAVDMLCGTGCGSVLCDGCLVIAITALRRPGPIRNRGRAWESLLFVPWMRIAIAGDLHGREAHHIQKRGSSGKLVGSKRLLSGRPKVISSRLGPLCRCSMPEEQQLQLCCGWAEGARPWRTRQ